MTSRSWSTETIRAFSKEGGGTPPCVMYVEAANGDTVGWLPSGEVFTAIPAGRGISRSYRGTVGSTRDDYFCEVS